MTRKPLGVVVPFDGGEDREPSIDLIVQLVAKDLARVPPRVLSSRALVIAITPLLDPRFARAVLDLAARGFDLAVLVVSPVAVTRALVDGARLETLATRLWALERRADLAALRRQGLVVMDWQPPEPLEAALVRARRRRVRLASAG